MVFIIEHNIPPIKRISLFCLFILYMAKIIYSTANLNILVQRNHNSGRLETGIPDIDLILLKGYNLVLASFVKPLPRKWCEAGFTNGDNTSRIHEAESSLVKCGFL